MLGLPKAGRLVDLVRSRRERPAIDPARVVEVVTALGAQVTDASRNTAQGWRSEVVIVDTTHGLRVIKAYRPDWPQSSIEHEHSVISELERLGFPSVRTCRTPDDRSVIEAGGRRHVVFEYVKGVNPASMHIPSTRRRSLLSTSARLLARLHDELADFDPAANHHVSEPAGESSRAYADMLHQLAGRDDVPEALAADHMALGTRVEHIAERLVELESQLEAQSFSQTVIHGDYGLHNLIFTAPDRAVVHDFELARRDRRLVDLVVVVSRLPLGLRREFLEAYRSAAGLQMEEFSALALVWEEYRLRGAVRSWRNALQMNSRARMATAARRLREAETVRTGRETTWL